MSALSSAFNAFNQMIASNPSGVASAASALGAAISTNGAVVGQATQLLQMFVTAVQSKDSATAGSAKIALVGLAAQLPASFNAAFSALCDPAIESDPVQFAIEAHQAQAALTAANSPGLLGSLFGRL
jgi:hypothetical protein